MSFIKRFTTFFLVIAMLSQTLSIVATLVNFEVNRQYYAALCVNKSRPELACEGKCVLMQTIENQVIKQQKKESDKLQTIVEADVNWIFEKEGPLSIKPVFSPFLIKKSPNFTYSNTLSRLSENSIFHPPIA
jgi:hypothetical protein